MNESTFHNNAFLMESMLEHVPGSRLSRGTVQAVFFFLYIGFASWQGSQCALGRGQPCGEGYYHPAQEPFVLLQW